VGQQWLELLEGTNTPSTTWGTLVKALRPLSELDANAESSKWSLVSGSFKKALGDSDLEFLSAFRSVQNADPLSDFYVVLDSEQNDRESSNDGRVSSPFEEEALPRSVSPKEPSVLAADGI